jgi:hypothetical protein
MLAIKSHLTQAHKKSVDYWQRRAGLAAACQVDGSLREHLIQ